MKQIILRAAALLLCLTCLALPALAAEEPLDAVAFFQENSNLDLTPYEGRVILLNVFTEWCPYCMQEMPDLKAVSDMYDEDAFQLVLIHPWDGEDASNSESVQKNTAWRPSHALRTRMDASASCWAWRAIPPR